MKNKELVSLNQILPKVGDIKGSFKFVYAVSKNINKVKAKLKELSKQLQTLPENYSEYNKEYGEIMAKYNKFDEKLNKSKELTSEGQKQMAGEMNNLQKKYKGVISVLESNIKKEKEILSQECNIELYKMSICDIPDNQITANQLVMLAPIFYDYEEENTKQSKLKIVEDSEQK